MTIYDIQFLNALMRQRLAPFVKKTFGTVSSGDELFWNWHLDLICDHLEQCAHGEIKRLIINVPPRSLKSICASVALPAWLLGRDPQKNIICASYSADLAGKMARDCRSVMEADWYQKLFPGTRLEKYAELDLVTTRSGCRYAASVGGTLTGRGGSIIIIDDPMKPQDALSDAARTTTNQWYDNTLYTRLNNKNEDVIILVMQRLHVDDLVAHVMGKEDWVVLNLPAIAEAEMNYRFSNGRFYVRKEGNILHTARESKETLDQIKKNIGSMEYSSQYQQQPLPALGNLIQWPWFKRYRILPDKRSGSRYWIFQSWDMAAKATEMSDYSVCTTLLLYERDYYVIDVYREKLEFPGLLKQVVRLGEKFKARTVLIEDSASGIQVQQSLRGMNLSFSFKAIKPDRDKITRMHFASVPIESGRVFLPESAPWLEAFENEIKAFPLGSHDDQVDSLSQALNWNQRRNTVHVMKLHGF